MSKAVLERSRPVVVRSQRLFTDITYVPKHNETTSQTIPVFKIRNTTNQNSYSTKKLIGSVGLSLLIIFAPFTVFAQDQAPTTDTVAQPDTTTETTTPVSESTPVTTEIPTVDSSAPVTPQVAPSTESPAPTPAPAVDPSVASVGESIAPQNVTGPQQPTGPDHNKYVLNTSTGLWENDYYTWNPKTGQTSPKSAPNYYFDPASKTWSTDKWVYSPESGEYIAVPTRVSPLVANQPNTNNSLFGEILSTGPNSNNNITNNSELTGFFDLFSKAAINNNLNSTATSGDASVSNNTLGGSAISGDASVLSNVINAINSVFGAFTKPVTTFFKNIFGDVSGDIVLNPDTLAPATNDTQSSNNSSVGTTGPNSTNSIDNSTGVTTTMNSASSGSIDNNLDLNARSGNADVSGNTAAGDANSGMATAVANIMNLINSSIVSGDTFLGMINIFGNYNGNILFPAGFLDSILGQATSSTNPASNTNQVGGTGPGSDNQINSSSNINANLNSDATNAIANDVNLNATSGQATVEQNTQAGNATSGDAKSNLTLINMTGQNVVGKNSFLVIVNVLGKWVGVIMDAPTGSTSALLAGEASNNSVDGTGPNSTNQIMNSDNVDLTLNANSDNAIHNNINANAKSGDATVAGNTTAGDATTGNAKVAANIVNITNSDISLSDWFGVLFINVFGSWMGNVGSGQASATQQGSLPSVQTTAIANNLTVFVPNTFKKSFNGANSSENGVDHSQQVVSSTASTPTSTSAIQSDGTKSVVQNSLHNVKSSLLANLRVTFLLFGLAGALFGLERFLYFKKRRLTI